MSWTDELVRVYDKCIENRDVSNRPVPMYFLQEDVQITISLNSDGTIPQSGFACVVSKGDESTLIPVTEDSAAKTGGDISRPFIEELQFIAKDYPEFGFDNAKKYEAYIKTLGDWVNSEYTNFAIQAVYKYISTASLIQDLIDVGLLSVDEATGKLLPEKINGTVLEKCKVRFSVDGVATWKDEAVMQSYTDYYSSKMKNGEICYASGNMCTPTYKHPFVLGTAKLFSFKDDSGFKFRGRFDNEKEAVAIGMDYSQKMHSALKWLLDKQGVSILKYDKSMNLKVLIWESSLNDTFNPIDGCINDYDDDDDEFSFEESADTMTGEIYRYLTVSSILGAKSKYPSDSKTFLLMIDCPASSYKGRCSLVMYEELQTSDYLNNLINWHTQTSVKEYNYKKSDYTEKSFSLYDILNCAYGREVTVKDKSKGEKDKVVLDCDDKDIRDCTFRRLIPCVTSAARIPDDIVKTLFYRACRPLSFNSKSSNWKKVLSCTCALNRKYMIDKKGVDNKMELKKDLRERDYLYGRLLAVAEYAESRFYYEKKRELNNDIESDNSNADSVSRTTNAMRYFEAFSYHPRETWLTIRRNLNPYLNRMSHKSSSYFKNMIDEITVMFPEDSFTDNSPLSAIFLEAYSCQMNELKHRKTSNNKEEN